MKTFRKSSLITSVALLLVAIVALGGATFAWFSTNRTASATGIGASTTQGSNLLISKQKTTGWDQSITFTDKTAELSPVTTADLSSWTTNSAEKWNSQAASVEYTASEDYIKATIYVTLDAIDETHNLKLNVNPTVNVDAEENPIGTLNYYRVAVQPITEEGLSNTTTNPTYFFANGENYAEGKAPGYETVLFGDVDLGTINSGETYGYNVYVWFEGEDLDCKDMYATNDISLALSFK